jgi:hypothetical protein
MIDSQREPYRGFEFPDDYAQGIAKIISYWSALEYNINLSIWHLAGIYPAIGACMTEQIFTLDGRLKALLALLKLRRAPEALVTRVNKFGEKSRKAQDVRNKIAHYTWHQGTESKQMLQLEIGAKRSLTFGFKPILIESLKADQDTVRNAMREAVEIRDVTEATLPKLPEIPLGELHPIVLHGRGHEQTRSIGQTFALFPPKSTLG